MENKTKIILGTIIVILLLGGYILNDKIIKPHYQEQGAVFMQNQIALTQTQTGNILIVNENNLTTINIQEICGGGE